MKLIITCLTFFLIFMQSNNIEAQEIVNEYNYTQNIELTNKGWQAINSDKYTESIKYFSEAIALYDGNTDSFSGKATAFLKLKKYDSALIYVIQALNISPNEADLNYLAGNISMRQHEYEKSIKYYSDAIAQNSTSEVKTDLANCFFNRGNAYLFSEQYSLSISDYDKVLNKKPEFANAYHNRGIAYRHLYKKQEACNNFSMALNFGSEKTSYYLNDYCKDITPKYLELASVPLRNQIAERLSIKKPDTVDVKLFYNSNWELTSKDYGACLREGQLRLSDKKFVGKFIDYYAHGQILVEGQYDAAGHKTGKFKRYYETGKPYSQGSYKNNLQDGMWKFYYESGKLREKIKFTGNDFYVEEYYDQEGNLIFKNGTGTWVKHFPVSSYEFYNLTAQFIDRRRQGKWKLKNASKQVVLLEVYEYGNFVSGKTGLPGSMEKYNETQLNSTLFYPASYFPIEEFAYSSQANQRDYPYLSNLPMTSQEILFNNSTLTNDNFKVPKLDEEFEVVEVQPGPPDGMAAFYKYIGMSMEYPPEARKNGIQGRVFVQFVVDKDGSLTEVRTIKGIGGGCDEEAERVIKIAPKWSPGMQKGKPVKVRMILPITFKLS